MIKYFTDYRKILKPDESIYIFKNKLDTKETLNLPEILNNISGKFYDKTVNNNEKVCIILSNQDFKIRDKKENKTFVLSVEQGTILFIGKKVDLKYEINISDVNNTICYYEDNVLSYIMKTIETRLIFGKVVYKELESIKNISNYTKDKKILGEGSFGKVFKTNIGNLNLALKTITKDDKNYYFHEVYILELLQNLITNKICPNLPYIYYFNLEPSNTGFFTELADGTFTIFLKKLEKLSYEKRHIFLEISLFQLMAALHTFQVKYQIWNYDIKKSNILYYNIQKGGYWKYTILGKDYYIPNLGFLLVINDFGISQVLSPKYISEKDTITKSFGTRIAQVKNNMFIPLVIDNYISGENVNVYWDDGEKSMGIKVSKKNVKDSLKIFENPDIPPFEFYNDTQDILRIYTGGVRASQNKVKEPHNRIKWCDPFIEKLDMYIGKMNDTRTTPKYFSKKPSEVLAGYFINDFFEKFTVCPKGVKILESYTIS